MAKCLVFLSAILSGCCSNPVDHKIGPLDEPELLPVEQELWDTLPPHVQQLILHNRLEWEDFYDDATEKVKAHDERLK